MLLPSHAAVVLVRRAAGMRLLTGFRSRCAISLPWTYDKPSTMSWKNRTATSSRMRPCRTMSARRKCIGSSDGGLQHGRARAGHWPLATPHAQSNSSPPSRCSMTSKIAVGVSMTSYSWMTFGWRTRFRILISRATRCTLASGTGGGGGTRGDAQRTAAACTLVDGLPGLCDTHLCVCDLLDARLLEDLDSDLASRGHVDGQLHLAKRALPERLLEHVVADRLAAGSRGSGCLQKLNRSARRSRRAARCRLTGRSNGSCPATHCVRCCASSIPCCRHRAGGTGSAAATLRHPSQSLPFAIGHGVTVQRVAASSAVIPGSGRGGDAPAAVQRRSRASAGVRFRFALRNSLRRGGTCISRRSRWARAAVFRLAAMHARLHGAEF